MAASHGKSTVVKLGTSAAPTTLTDVSQYVSSEDLSRQADTHETTTFGKDAKTYIPGLKDGTFSQEYVWDPVLDAHIDGILGKQVNFEISPAGTASGAVKYTGAAICTDYSGSNPVGDVATASAEFQITGDVTRATHA
jgi:hypothetical protein